MRKTLTLLCRLLTIATIVIVSAFNVAAAAQAQASTHSVAISTHHQPSAETPPPCPDDGCRASGAHCCAMAHCLTAVLSIPAALPSFSTAGPRDHFRPLFDISSAGEQPDRPPRLS